MRSVRGGWRTTVLLVVLASSSCGKAKPQSPGTGGATSIPGSDGGTGGQGGGAGSLTACIDRPGELPRPPADGLPCELIPPGLAP